MPPPTVTLFGSPFVTWRGLPLVPSDKLYIDEAGKTKILLLRTGEKKQGVVGLFQPGVPGEVAPSLSVRFTGINRKAIASYLISLYCSAAVLTHDALACSKTSTSANITNIPTNISEPLQDRRRARRSFHFAEVCNRCRLRHRRRNLSDFP